MTRMYSSPYTRYVRCACLCMMLFCFACGKKANPAPPPVKTQLDLLTTGTWNAKSATAIRASDGTTVTLASNDFGGLLLDGMTFTGDNLDKSAGTFTSKKANGGYGVDVFLTIWFNSSPNVKYGFSIPQDITESQLTLDEIGTIQYNHHDGTTETFSKLVVTYGH